MIVGSRIRLSRCPSSECLPVRSASAVVIDTVPDLRRASPGSGAAGQPGTNSARRGGEAHPRALQEPEEDDDGPGQSRSEEHTSELQSLMRISYAVFCLKKNTHIKNTQKI